MTRYQVCGTMSSRITIGFYFDTQSAELQCVRGSASRDAQPFRCAPGRPGYHSPNCGILNSRVCSARTKGEVVALEKRYRDRPSEVAVEGIGAQMRGKACFSNGFQRFSSNRKNSVTQLPAPHVCSVAASLGKRETQGILMVSHSIPRARGVLSRRVG